MKTTELAIVGGGPAGLSAAIEAAKVGVPSIIIDENQTLGGQMFRRVPSSFTVHDEKKLGEYYVKGGKFLREVAEFSNKIDVWTESLVWGLFEDKQLAIIRDGNMELLKADQLVITPGAYDRAVPFTGWTLPGVFTAGCTQVMMKSQRMLLGSRFLLAGSGPLQLTVADQLLKSGAKVLAVVEAASMKSMWRYVPNLLNEPSLMWDGFKYLATLKLHGVPFLQSHIIIKAIGSEQVEGAVIAAVDKDWQPILGTERTLEVDAICIGYGLIPNTDLARLCGCAHGYDLRLGGWVTICNENMETTVPGIFVAGDGRQIAGFGAAIEQGKLAGMYAARNLGVIDAARAEKVAKPVRRRLKRHLSFQSGVGKLYAVRPGIYGLADEGTLVCRCEEITLGDIRRAMQEGAVHPNDIKRRTRAGMGFCQGRICAPAIQGIVERELGIRPDALGQGRVRNPLKPIPLGAIQQYTA